MENSKLIALRKSMKQKGINALIIPSTDPHQSEYIADYWKCRQWITGFNGSAGVAIVTNSNSHLWTDSRYFIQAENELDAPFELKKQTTKQPEYFDWLFKHLNFDDSIGYNGQLFSETQLERFSAKLSTKQIKLVDIGDIFESIWTDRPKLSINPIFEHHLKFAGISRINKINNLKDKLQTLGATNLVITKLDDIAWLLNIRGSDIEYNPVPSTYFLISNNIAKFFAHKSMLSDELKESLMQDNIELYSYNEIEDELKKIKPFSRVIVEKSTISKSLINAIPHNCEMANQNNIIAYPKSIKNPIELENYNKAQLRDSIALCGFLKWLEDNYHKQSITELSAAIKLEEFRSSQENFKGISFNSISAFGANAALPHYSATEENNSIIDDSNLYLIDSGGQYLDGTTDITRTICLGQANDQQKEDFTLVLKGHIKLAMAKFPIGTKGYQLDPLARHALWEHGKDFGHGTGHGIGYFLNVHEGPQGFSPEANGPAGTAIEPGMLITNEPGYYLEGEYGIRIENVLLCAPCKESSYSNFLEFKTVNYCPIDINLINKNLLSKSEIDWLNNYHKTTFDKLSPFIDENLKIWLKEKTNLI